MTTLQQQMTTLQQQMQTGPAKASEIFAKLADTSPTAVKTRERLIADLKGELDRQAEFEEQRLFPVLKKHDEAKDLVAEALKNNQQMRKLLTELERSPKDEEAFGAKVAELGDLFRKHLRDDSKEFLPAIVKALNDEGAGAAGEKVKAETTENAPARRADGGEHRPEDKHEEASAARQGAEIVKAGAELAQQGATLARIATTAGADANRERNRATPSVTAQEASRETARTAGVASVGLSMVALLNEQAQHVLQVQTVLVAGHARTLAELAQVQSAFMAASFQRMGQVNDRYLAYVRCWPGLRHHSVHPSLMV